ncbi:hypothetical protein K466DRAFT_547919 [Polyporus arcularius HHB13444]|uniref:C3H1-type domain-containing protein n=1 Tax=Polyporus arcularius HHB13444 TaxID=1314778 RepID=A0A5C3PFY6_9APHY|nr:hypothetical protein K466DRAFT_547919 [Polyporus arcularius HHB13444]
MLYDPTTANVLKPWLVRTLEPICDAEPGALAEYILALLKHNAPEAELRKELGVQLEEFLEKECSPFIDTLFTALRTKSYMPYSDIPSSSTSPPYASSSTSADAGIPIPLDGLMNPQSTSPDRGRKRGHEQDGYDSHGPPKGARINQDGQFSRYGGRGDNHTSWGGRGDRGARMDMNGARADYMDGGMVGMGMNGGMNGRGGQSYRPPEQRRGICRDYHNSGFCARGAFCKYSHGDDAVVPTQMFPMGGGGMPFMPMMGPGGMQFPMGGGDSGPYNPHERMDMPQMGGMGGGRLPNARPAVLPRTEGGESSIARNPGELPVIQDLTPQIPIEDVSPYNTGEGFPHRQQHPPQQRGPMQMEGVLPGGNVNGMAPQQLPQQDQPPRPHSTGRGGAARGRGRGGVFNGDAQSFRPQRRDDKTLVVEKIPEDKLALGAVNDWFSKFGTVTNVAVDALSAKALVSFSSHDEAHKAWKSEEAVFGNRFVKVFWHRPMEGHGQAGQRMLAASANIVANRAGRESVSGPPAGAKEGSPAPPTPNPATAPTSRQASTSSSAAAALAAKQKLLEQQIAEQKTLMGKLSTATPEEKKEIMARLRKLGEEMKPPAAAMSSQSPPPAASTSATAPLKRSVSGPARSEEQERAERERLDKELEMLGESDESTEALQAKLEKLKAEAASLGIPVASEAPYSGTSYRPYRGRGRGGARSYYRGAMRGGPPRASMKLDNRPKKLVVKGASPESTQAVRDWYETTGQVESVETLDSGDILVSFRSRAAAEQGFAKGSHIALVGPVQVSWYSGQAAGAVTAPSAGATPGPSSSDAHKDTNMDGVSASVGDGEDSHMGEEAEPTGWGDDDAFGMM